MNRTLTLRILGVAAVLVGLLVALVVRETQARDAGREVWLPMELVDPRDLLTGHYVALQLVQSLPTGQRCPPGTDRAMSRGWIALAPGPKGARVAGFAVSRPGAAPFGPVLLKGRVDCSAAVVGEDRPGRISLDIGVDRFHADQQQAEALDKALRERKTGDDSAYAVISVGEDGKGRLKGVIVAGHRADLSWN
jgi:hypothetical protein